MNYFIFSIKDTVTGHFSELKLFINEQSAIRFFDGLCLESKISKDLQLFCLGIIDIASGIINPCCEFIKGGISNE